MILSSRNKNCLNGAEHKINGVQLQAKDHALVQKVADYEEQKQLALDRISTFRAIQVLQVF